MNSTKEIKDLLKSDYARSRVRAAWTRPAPDEPGAPAHRIIHGRALDFSGPTRLRRIGLRYGHGYLKCGSDWPTLDWLADVRVLGYAGGQWSVLAERRGLPRPENWSKALTSVPEDERPVEWIDLDGAVASAVLVEGRRSGVDDWWPSYNLLSTAVIVEGDEPAPSTDGAFRLLKPDIDFGGLPSGVDAVRLPHEVRLRTRFLEVGFSVYHAGLTYLCVDDEGAGRTGRNLLAAGAQPLNLDTVQGLHLDPVGARKLVSDGSRELEGTMTVRGSRVEYDVRVPAAGQRFQLAWKVREDGMSLDVIRTGDRDVRVWNAAACQLVFDESVATTAVVGPVQRFGQAGIVKPPLLVHAPGCGSLQVVAEGDVLWRSDVYREKMVCTSEIVVGQVPQEEGDWLLPAGTRRASIGFHVTQFAPKLRAGAPPIVRRALARCAHTALTYRPDTATLTNNACSMHSPICADGWADSTLRIGQVVGSLNAADLLRDSIQRWLDGASAYASGNHSFENRRYEAEYVHTQVAGLVGIAEYLRATGDYGWLASNREAIRREIDYCLALDIDHDGLVESTIRLGISGQKQWSTCWYDVISFGWKDAWINAILYGALRILPDQLIAGGALRERAAQISQWANQLAGSYFAAFRNPATGRIAGWRSRDDRLHDHAFLYVNGAAVNSGLLEGTEARALIEGLWRDLKGSGAPDFRLGLPGNLVPVPNEDYALGPQHAYAPYGSYENGALTHSQSRHFVRALYRVGMQAEGDEVLEALCESLADGTAFGGCGSGVDWKHWDGSASGYEGLLSDQFGILGVALERWGA